MILNNIINNKNYIIKIILHITYLIIISNFLGLKQNLYINQLCIDVHINKLFLPK